MNKVALLVGLSVFTGLSFVQAAKVNEDGKQIVVIEKFDNNTGEADVTQIDNLRTRIKNDIVNTRKFEVLERGPQLEKVLAERNRIASGMVEGLEDGEEQPKLKSAGYAIYGEVLYLGGEASSTAVGEGSSADKVTIKVEVQLNLADIETGKIVASKNILVAKSQTKLQGMGNKSSGNMAEGALRDAIAAASKKIVGELMNQAFPKYVLAVNQNTGKITVNLTKEETELDKIYEIISEGEELIDPDSGESLGSEEEVVARATVVKCNPKTAQLEIIGDEDISDIEKGMLVRPVDEEVLKREAKKQKARAKKRFESRF